ncbi:MAG: DUF6029 family protein [Myxococcota bacterium]|nr:DUF6029 family protein [Myxococcota bacterium]
MLICLGTFLLTYPRECSADRGVSVDESFTVDFRDDNENGELDDDNYGLILSRLSFSAHQDALSLDGRLDNLSFFDPPTESFRDRHQLERVSLRYRWKKLKLTVGDFYQVLGRGQVLALQKMDPAAPDVTLRGAHLELRAAQNYFELFGGYSNAVNLDMVSMHDIENRDDLLAGFNYQLSHFDFVQPSLFYVFSQPEESLLPDAQDMASSGGVALNFPELSDWCAGYIEFDYQQRLEASQVIQGQATYLNLDMNFELYSIELEAINVENFSQEGSRNSALKQDFRYNFGPTLERLDQEVTEFNYFRGARGKLTRSLFDHQLFLYGNGLYRYNVPFELDQVHGYLGALYEGEETRLDVSGGYRWDEQRSGQIVRIWRHAELSLKQHLSGLYSLELDLTGQQVTQYGKTFHRAINTAGLARARLGSITGEWGVDTQRSGPGIRQHFFAGHLELHILDTLRLKAVVGSQRGGLKCVGGICRDFPAFSGARVHLSYQRRW